MSLVPSEVVERRIYVLGCWHKNYLVAYETVREGIHMSLVAEVQIQCVRVERIKNVYIHSWLLEKILSARQGLQLTECVIRLYRIPIYTGVCL